MDRINNLDQEQTRRVLETLIWLSQIFWGPEPGSFAALFDERLPAEMEDMAGILESHGFPAGAGAAREIGAWAQAGSDQGEAELEEAFVRLFVSNRDGLAAPLFQSCYQGEGLMMGPPAIGMERRLAEAGLSLEMAGNQPPDHLAAELEYLVVMLEAALEQGNRDARQAAESFASGELQAWLPEFARRLEGVSGSSLYASAARLAVETLRLAGWEAAQKRV